jgi:xylan 1,4-beta-xylosidase
MKGVTMMRGWSVAVAACVFGAAIGAGAQASEANPVTIRIDASKNVGAYTPIYSWFGYDEANYTTAANGKKLLGELHDLSPVPVYIRAHHLLTTGDGVPDLKWSSTNVFTLDANGKPVYDFRILDGIFDAYKAAGVRPMVELGFMPEALAEKIPSRKNQPYRGPFPGNVLSGAVMNPPKDYALWGSLVEHVMQHWIARYGADDVKTWYFEVWNEPNLEYWHGTPAEYYKLYDFTSAAVKRALPEARVGGPASTGPGSQQAYDFLKGFFEHVRDSKSAATGGAVPLDFISFHAKGRPKFIDNNVTMGINKEIEDVDRGFSLIASFPKFAKLPIILSEADPEGCAGCSSKTNPANNYRNGTLYPAYTAAAYARLFELADKYKVNLISMLSWSFEFEDRESFEGFRELATNGVDKPVLNFFRMAGKMSGERVQVASSGAVPMDTIRETGVRAEPDVDALATKDAHRLSIMAWNYQDTISQDRPLPVQLLVQGLPADAKQVKVREWRLDDKTSNAYTAWQAMGSPAHPNAEQSAELQKTGQLQEFGKPFEAQVTDGHAQVEETLPGESVSLFELTW